MNGVDVADSQLSMEHIIDVTKKDMDAHLSPQERAIARAMSITMSERFHWVMALDRLIFNDGKFLPKMSSKLFFLIDTIDTF